MQSALSGNLGPDTHAGDSEGGPASGGAASEDPAIIKHPHLFLEDGDLELWSAIDAASNTRTSYKLHTAVLETHMPTLESRIWASAEEIPGKLSARILTALFSFMYSNRDGVTVPTYEALGNVDTVLDLLELAWEMEMKSLQKMLECSIK